MSAGLREVDYSNGNGRAVLVTGARKGIGRAIAYAMASARYNVVLNDLVRDAAAEETVAGVNSLGGQATLVTADISNVDIHECFLDQVWEAFGRLDCLVNNAGVQVSVRGDLLDVSPSEFDLVMGTNQRGTFFLTQAVARRMLSDGEASHGRAIVNITSANAVMASPEKAAYCLSKSSLSMATRLYALRLAKHGINVFEVRPGLIKTDMTADVRDKYSRLIEDGLSPIARWGDPEEVGQAVAALAGGAIPFTTGHAFDVDGGLQIQRL